MFTREKFETAKQWIRLGMVGVSLRRDGRYLSEKTAYWPPSNALVMRANIDSCWQCTTFRTYEYNRLH